MDLQITPHRFRHTHCSLLFEIGASIKETGDRFAKFMGMELKRTQKRIQNNFRQIETARNDDLTTFRALNIGSIIYGTDEIRNNFSGPFFD